MVNFDYLIKCYAHGWKLGRPDGVALESSTNIHWHGSCLGVPMIVRRPSRSVLQAFAPKILLINYESLRQSLESPQSEFPISMLLLDQNNLKPSLTRIL